MRLEKAMFLLPGLVIGLSLHEFAHAWSARLLGDNFSRRQGRVSLNPFRHLSILGTLAIFLLPIGWGKPVQVNLYNFRNPKRDYLITSLAGPLANIIVVLCCIGLAQITRNDCRYGAGAQAYLTSAHSMLIAIALINTVLAAINLLPIPPLDGSKIWPCLIPGLKPSFGSKGIMIFIIAIMLLMHNGALDPVLRVAFNSTSYYMPYPDSALCEAYDDLGAKSLDNGDLNQANVLFSAAVDHNPRAHRSLRNRAEVYLIAGRLQLARTDIEAALAFRETPEYRQLQQKIAEAIRLRDASIIRQAASQPASGPAE